MSTPTSIRRPRTAAPSAFAVAIAAAVAGALATGQAAPPRPAPAAEKAREARVLAVLGRELDGRSSFWFWYSKRVKQPEEKGGRVVLEIPVTCGNSMGGRVPVERGRDLVAKLGGAFGAKCDVEVDDKRLPIMDGDRFTPLCSLAVEAIERLDATCDGEDVDVSILLGGSMNVWPLPKASDAAGRVDPTIVAGAAARFESEKKIRFEVRPDAPGAGAVKRGLQQDSEGAVRSTAGRVALLSVPILPTTDLAGTGMPTFKILVTQDAVAVTASTAMVWLPSTFDAKKPFTVEVDLGPGVWTFGTQLLATAPDR